MAIRQNIIIAALVVFALLFCGVSTLHNTASVGIIGGSDGPAAIYVTTPDGVTQDTGTKTP